MNTRVHYFCALLLAAAVAPIAACGASSTVPPPGDQRDETARAQRHYHADAGHGVPLDAATASGGDDARAEPPRPVADAGRPPRGDATSDLGSAAADALASQCNQICGDVTGDGVVNSADQRVVQRHAVREIVLRGCALRAGDVTGDGRVDTIDARLIQRVTGGEIQLQQLLCPVE